MARRPHRSFQMQRSSRLTQWLGPAFQGYVSVASGGATLISTATFEDPVTLMRSRGMVSITPTAVSADLDLVGAFGVGIVSAEAAAAGVASMPEPYSDSDWGGWVVWRSFAYHFEFATAAAVNYPRFDFEVDSKAMRKISASETIVTIAESVTGAFEISSNLRRLIKLP